MPITYAILTNFLVKNKVSYSEGIDLVLLRLKNTPPDKKSLEIKVVLNGITDVNSTSE